MTIKLKFFISIDQQENWLNKQLPIGRCLSGVTAGCLNKFKTIETSHQIIRLDYRVFGTGVAFEDYLLFMQEADKAVCSTFLGMPTYE